MKHFNAALDIWTIPNSKFGEFLPVLAVKLRKTNLNFHTVQTLIIGLLLELMI